MLFITTVYISAGLYTSMIIYRHLICRGIGVDPNGVTSTPVQFSHRSAPKYI